VNVTLAPVLSFVAKTWSCNLSDALNAKLPGEKLRFSAAGILGCFDGTVVVEPDDGGVIAKVRTDTALAGSLAPV
jgi:hypothetical protein